MLDSLKPGLAYFALTFGAGFVLGSIRVPFLVPRIGVRFAELLEMPVMLAVTILAAGWVIRRFSVPASTTARLGMGLGALLLLIGAELSLATLMSGGSVVDYIRRRDPVSGGVYLAMLALFAAMPLILRRFDKHRS